MVDCERHHGAERKAGKLAGMRRKGADEPNRGERASAFGERRFGYIRSCRSGPSVLSIGHLLRRLDAQHGSFFLIREQVQQSVGALPHIADALAQFAEQRLTP
jgi:hypothetical protein